MGRGGETQSLGTIKVHCVVFFSFFFFRLSSSGSSQLEDVITVDQFSQLVKLFQRHGEWQRSTGTTQLATPVFQQILAKLLGHSEDDEKIVMLCNKVGISPGPNQVLKVPSCNVKVFFYQIEIFTHVTVFIKFKLVSTSTLNVFKNSLFCFRSVLAFGGYSTMYL